MDSISSGLSPRYNCSIGVLQTVLASDQTRRFSDGGSEYPIRTRLTRRFLHTLRTPLLPLASSTSYPALSSTRFLAASSAGSQDATRIVSFMFVRDGSPGKYFSDCDTQPVFAAIYLRLKISKLSEIANQEMTREASLLLALSIAAPYSAFTVADATAHVAVKDPSHPHDMPDCSFRFSPRLRASVVNVLF